MGSITMVNLDSYIGCYALINTTFLPEYYLTRITAVEFFENRIRFKLVYREDNPKQEAFIWLTEKFITILGHPEKKPWIKFLYG